MKKIFSLGDNNNFSLISGDKNKIHLDNNYTKNLFVKLPIVHGSHIIILALSEFLKKNKSKKYFINFLNVKFINYLNINEKFEIILFEKKIFVKANNEIILEIVIDFLEKKKITKKKQTRFRNYQFKNLANQSLIKELMDISKYIGSISPGNGSLILNLEINFHLNKKINTIRRKITKQVFRYTLSRKNYNSNLIVSKLKPFKIFFDKFTPQKKINRKLKNKSVLIFGSSGNLGSYAKYFFSKYDVKVNLADRTLPKRKNKKFNFYKINFKNEKNLKDIILQTKPDYVLYFSSPKIRKATGQKFNKKLFNNFNFYYYVYFKKIIKYLNGLDKKVLFFYPSTAGLNKSYNNFKFLKEYIQAKTNAEKICKKKHINNIKIISHRIEQIKCPQNYNIAGFYEGRPISIMKKYIEKLLL